MSGLSSSDRSKQETVAAFDFDGTLTVCDTLIPFLWFVSGTAQFLGHNLRLYRQWCLYLIGRMDNSDFKRAVIRQFLAGSDWNEVVGAGERFAHEIVGRLVRREAIRALRGHLRQGHRCVIVTASPEILVKLWAKDEGIHEVMGTRLEVGGDGKRLTGNLDGLNCWGAEKRRRLEQTLGPRRDYTLIAYGDSEGDREMLAMADVAWYRQFEKTV